MFRLMKLVSKKSIMSYAIIYLLLKIIYLLNPMITMLFIDAIVEHDVKGSFIYAITAIMIFFISQFLDYIFDIKQGKNISEAWCNLCFQLDYKIRNYDTKKYNISITEFQQIIGQNYEIAKGFIFINPIQTIFSIFTIVVIMIILLNISTILFLIIIILFPLGIIISTKYSNQIEERSLNNLEDVISLKSCLEDELVLSKSERLIDEKQIPTSTFIKLIKNYQESMVKKVKKIAYVNNIISYGFLNGTILITILIAGYLILKGEISIGALYAVQIYVSQLWGPGEFLMRIKNEYHSSLPMINKILDILHLESARYYSETINRISINNYISKDGTNRELHNPVDYNFDKGIIYLIAGDNGVGKTTLIESLLGYTNRYNGSIKYNGHEANGVPTDIVYVSAIPYISKLWNPVIHKGSSGQKKINQIGLALKTNKTVYIFDEPTNFLDESNKVNVIENICKNNYDKIIIIISHDIKIKEIISQDPTLIYEELYLK